MPTYHTNVGHMKNKRKNEILEILMIRKFLKMEWLVQHFGVSIETIRRDIKELINLRIIKKVYGGIQILTDNTMVSELENWNIRNNRYHEEKQHIAHRAAELISNGSTIALDTGTTAHALATILETKQNLKIIISSIRIASELARSSSHEIFFIGGQLNKEEQVTMGTFTHSFLDHFALIDLFFCSADGFSIDCGITECSEAVADVKRQLIAISGKNILMADHSKFGKKALFKSCPVEYINTVVTDSQTPAHYLESLRERGIQVIIA